jgi:hypothetical protein
MSKHGRYERNKKDLRKLALLGEPCILLTVGSNSIGGSVRTGIITHSGASPYVSLAKSVGMFLLLNEENDKIKPPCPLT